MEEVTLITTEETESKHNLNLSMLLAVAKQNGGQVKIRIGSYKCLLKVLKF